VILSIDIGNSSVKAAVFEGAQPAEVLSLSDDSLEALTEALGGRRILHSGIASVVPARTAAVAAAVREATGTEPLIVHAGIDLPFALAYETPGTLGADRIAAAAGAVALFPEADPLVVIDAGTAVTIEVISEGTYRGGAIAPGPDVLRRALAAGTAQLPEVSPELPSSPIGRSTRQAIQAGVMMGFVGAVRELLARTAEQLPSSPRVVATGGWGPVLAAHLSEIDDVEPLLVLRGVRALVERAHGGLDR
jgi:type III pantothenate kinase